MPPRRPHARKKVVRKKPRRKPSSVKIPDPKRFPVPRKPATISSVRAGKEVHGYNVAGRDIIIHGNSGLSGPSEKTGAGTKTTQRTSIKKTTRTASKKKKPLKKLFRPS